MERPIQKDCRKATEKKKKIDDTIANIPCNLYYTIRKYVKSLYLMPNCVYYINFVTKKLFAGLICAASKYSAYIIITM